MTTVSKKEKLHAHIDNAATTPEHTYVEQIKSPRRGENCNTDEEWLNQKHAHVDDDAPSPHGLVQRVQTPLHEGGEAKSTNQLDPDEVIHTTTEASGNGIMKPQEVEGGERNKRRGLMDVTPTGMFLVGVVAVGVAMVWSRIAAK